MRISMTRQVCAGNGLTHFWHSSEWRDVRVKSVERAKDGVIGRQLVDTEIFWSALQLMVKEVRVTAQASEGEAQHGPFGD